MEDQMNMAEGRRVALNIIFNTTRNRRSGGNINEQLDMLCTKPKLIMLHFNFFKSKTPMSKLQSDKKGLYCPGYCWYNLISAPN